MKENVWHYNRAAILEALDRSGIRPGDTVFSHISLGRLGFAQEGRDLEHVSDMLYGAFREILGPAGTLLIPTFTYSIGKPEIFDVQNTPSVVGPFTEQFRKRPGVIRSRDPMLAVSGEGPLAEPILTNLPPTSYGKDCVYDRLRKHHGKICNIGLSLYWATFLHHIEEMAGVPFRFRKMFQGWIMDNGLLEQISWLYFAAPRISNCESDSFKLDLLGRELGNFSSVPLGRSEVVCMDAEAYFDFGMQALKKDPWFTAKGPACSIAQIIQKEDARIGAGQAEVDLPRDATVEQIIDRIWALPRDIISDGYDRALRCLEKQLPMLIHEYPTGTSCWTWIIPEKWTCEEAYLEKLDGTRLFSRSDHPLHVASYSQPFSGTISREELLDHLYVHPIVPEAIPFKYNYYNGRWDLCCSKSLKDSLRDETYRVEIKSEFSFGSLKVGEVCLKGDTEDCIVLCAHLCHPAMVNDGLSGVVAGIELMRRLAGLEKRRYTYRLLILPETIGSVAYLSHNEALIPKMKGGLFLEMLGLKNPHALQLSFQADTIFDRCCIQALKSHDPDGWTESFLEVVTNDERQFNAPGVRVPMLSLSRVPRGTPFFYPEYHSNLDTPALNSTAHLYDSCDLVMKMIDIWEHNVIPRPTFKGEPFLSRFNIRFSYETDPEESHALFKVIFLLDGRNSLIDIAEKGEVPFRTVKKIIDRFRDNGLVDFYATT